MAELIGAGAFKVDRTRALDKLMHFQLPDPSLFPIPLVRCAVSSGATKIAVKFSPGEVLAEFDGRPLAAAELRDPYACLLEDHRAESRPRRELATALLTALRLNPKSITVESGAGSARTRLTVRSLKEEALEASASRETSTRIRVQLPFLSLFSQNWELLPAGAVLKRCQGIPLELRFFNNVPHYPGWETPELDGGLSFTRGTVRGRIWPAAQPNQPSRLRLYNCGLEAGEVWNSFSGPQVEGWINDDGFSLNASQTGTVHNERHDAALELVRGMVAELVPVAVGALQGALTELAGPLMAGGRALSLWKDGLARGPEAEKAGLWAGLSGWVSRSLVPEETGKKILAAARIMAWLRASASDDKVLREAPLFLGTDGAPLSLAAIKTQLDRLGYVPASKDPFPGRKWPVAAAWLPDPREWGFLEKFFPGEVRDVTATLSKIARGRDSWGQTTGLGLIKPANALLAEKLEIPGLTGEIGLLEDPPPKSRIHLFFKGLACGSIAHPCGLRYTAVVECGSEGPIRSRLEKIEAAAIRLYRIAGESGRAPNAALRRHIADFFDYAFRKGPDFLNRHAWLQSVPLFRGLGVDLTLNDLRQMLENGRSFYLCALEAAPPEVESRAILAPPNFGQERLQRIFPQYRLMIAADLVNTWLVYKPTALPASAPFRDDDLEQMISVLEQLGGLYEKPEHPARKPLLQAILRFHRPSLHRPPGKGADEALPRAAHFGELLRNLPVFSTPRGSGGTVTWVSRRLSHQLTYAEPGPDSKKSKADLILSPEELDIIRALFPKRMMALTPVVETGPKPPPAPGPAPEIFPPAESVIFRKGYFLGDLEYHFALPSTFTPPTMSASIEGKPVSSGMLAQALCWVGSIRIQRRGREAEDLPSPTAVQHLLSKFYRDFLEIQFPKLNGHDRQTAAAYLMSLLIQDRRQAVELPSWRALIADLRRAPLFQDGCHRSFSLDGLAAKARPDGTILYLTKPGKKNSAPVDLPILPKPDLVSKLLKQYKGKRLLRHRPERLRPKAPPPPEKPSRPKLPASLPAAPASLAAPTPPPSAAPNSDPLSLARELLNKVRVSGVIAPETLGESDGPLKAAVLFSALADPDKAAYLASLAGSSSNRRRPDFTDSEEIQFQQTLVRHLMEETSR